MQASMKLGEAVYKAQQAAASGGPSGGDGDASGGGTSGSTGGEDVVDADFEEIPEDERRPSA